MSKPFKEVIIYQNVAATNQDSRGNRIGLVNDTGIRIGSNSANIYVMWSGSIQDFINDFELPQDYINYWKTKTNTISGNSDEIFPTPNIPHNTINFKVNLEFWYRLKNGDTSLMNYAPSANVTFDITLPNFLSYSNAVVGNGDDVNLKAYNPNLFPIFLSNSTFAGSNKHSDSTYDGQTYGGLGTGVPFIVFRYGVGGTDLQICFLSYSNNVWDRNGSPTYLGRASLTFLGFNSAKRVHRREDN